VTVRRTGSCCDWFHPANVTLNGGRTLTGWLRTVALTPQGVPITVELFAHFRDERPLVTLPWGSVEWIDFLADAGEWITLPLTPHTRGTPT